MKKMQKRKPMCGRIAALIAGACVVAALPTYAANGVTYWWDNPEVARTASARSRAPSVATSERSTPSMRSTAAMTRADTDASRQTTIMLTVASYV